MHRERKPVHIQHTYRTQYYDSVIMMYWVNHCYLAHFERTPAQSSSHPTTSTHNTDLTSRALLKNPASKHGPSRAYEVRKSQTDLPDRLPSSAAHSKRSPTTGIFII